VATHASALKAHRQNLKRRAANRQLRSRLRTALKKIRAAIEAGDATTRESLRGTLALIDRMASKGIIHRNTAGRYKSRIVKRLNKTSTAA
jgi:small subunit ribosomal protein S20